MARSPLDPRYNDFLFASIGEEGNGMHLSVLSAFARLGMDPWQEAEQLTQLPKDLAAQRLATSIAALPSGQWTPSDTGAIAHRLINLLPAQSTSNRESVNRNDWLSRLAHVWI